MLTGPEEGWRQAGIGSQGRVGWNGLKDRRMDGFYLGVEIREWMCGDRRMSNTALGMDKLAAMCWG